ncbi:MAG: TrbG/VirB9 family P-type conjugative transfer protein [Alphaproteobacteria bacterium]|nr:TrbG/VirB9 family P-type conjugative transfer protein [Alphaproteobacteria bacterium]
MKRYLKIRLFTVVSVFCCLMSQSVSAQQQTAARESMDAAIEQSNGQYSEIDMPFWSVGMQQKAWNKPMEHLGEGQSKPGYSRYYWTPDLVLPLRIREGMHTLVNFPSWELIENVFIGNESAFGAQKVASNALMIFAASVDLVGMDTNMIVFGRSGNRYVFYLRSETFNTDRITNSVVDILVNDAKFVPDDSGLTPASSGTVSSGGGFGGGFSGKGGSAGSGKKTTKNPTEDWLVDMEVDPEKLRFDIDVFVPNPADMEIAPERVWRDEIFTYIDFGPKALTMMERPIVNLLSQGSEVPVGFRTRGPNGRLMVVEGIGDLVLRNGKRLLCLKIRKDPAFGTEFVEYEASVQPKWSPGPMITTGGYNGNVSATAQGNMPNNGMTMMPMGANGTLSANQIMQFSMQQPRSQSYIRSYRNSSEGGFAIELGTDSDISALEKKWDGIARKNKDLLGNFEPYYSIDTVAEGEAKDMFRLRIGPVDSIEAGDKLCNQLGRRGVTCMVVRTQ